MKKFLAIFIFAIFFFSLSASAQILSPTATLTAVLDSQTQGFFIGKTSINGVFEGFEMDIIQDHPLVYEINVIPLFGYTVIKSIDRMKMIHVDSLSPELLKNMDNISELNATTYTDIDIIAEKGPILIASHHGGMYVESELSYAICSIINQTIQSSTPNQFLVIASSSTLTAQFTGEPSYLIPYETNQKIQIQESDGTILWSGISNEYIFVIEDEDYSIYQDSSLYLLPLNSNDSHTTSISISPSDSPTQDIMTILDDITNSSEHIEIISDISENIKEFESVLSAVSPIVNGGLILVNTQDTVIIDGTTQSFSQIGFARGNTYEITLSNETNTPIIHGDFRLIFLGDHMYTAQANKSDTGIAFPILILIFWIIALVLFILFRFYPKFIQSKQFKQINEITMEKIKKFSLFFQISMLIVVFILVDREISYQFGTSIIDAILGQGLSLILIVFILIQLILWSIGFFALALPIRIITNSGLQFIGIGTSGRSLGKGIGLFGIWIFSALYVKLFINLILLFVSPASLFAMG
ncbi:MAG: hypothetical protein R6V50_05225 [Thermoplasmatota archaeon]